eukprot:TRINITY_DN11161_c0_g1_i1.p1 TRINITY_DN11161_c0_g1~~TRINITY_DN11161_c0_g1_i1.p1  ORF type:complete len:241 (-),score=-33.61 TRINITY_DN11161_c0_g1_i1:91-813(-)
MHLINIFRALFIAPNYLIYQHANKKLKHVHFISMRVSYHTILIQINTQPTHLHKKIHQPAHLHKNFLIPKTYPKKPNVTSLIIQLTQIKTIYYDRKCQHIQYKHHCYHRFQQVIVFIGRTCLKGPYQNIQLMYFKYIYLINVAMYYTSVKRQKKVSMLNRQIISRTRLNILQYVQQTSLSYRTCYRILGVPSAPKTSLYSSRQNQVKLYKLQVYINHHIFAHPCETYLKNKQIWVKMGVG